MITTFIPLYCFVLRWQCDVSVEISRCQGASLLPPCSSNSKSEGKAAQAACVTHVAANQIRSRAIMKQLPTLNVASPSREICVFLKNQRVLFVALLSDADSRSCGSLGVASGPEQTCAAFRHWIAVFKFQIELEEHKSLRKAMCPVWRSIQVQDPRLWGCQQYVKGTVNCLVLSLFISSQLFHSVSEWRLY
jgi:hypothetical protein